MSIMNKMRRSKKQKRVLYIVTGIVILSFLISIISAALI